MKKYTYKLFYNIDQYDSFTGTDPLELDKLDFRCPLCLPKSGIIFNLTKVLKIQEIITDEEEGGQQ